jgi:hypothetical protein
MVSTSVPRKLALGPSWTDPLVGLAIAPRTLLQPGSAYAIESVKLTSREVW